jgi:hypothetical protein
MVHNIISLANIAIEGNHLLPLDSKYRTQRPDSFMLQFLQLPCS